MRTFTEGQQEVTVKFQPLAAAIMALALAACASPPPPASIEVPSDRYTVELRPGDLISVTVTGSGTSAFCFGSIDARGIHALGGPRIVPLDTIEKLVSERGGCLSKAQRKNALKTTGEVVGTVLIAPFILTCMALGGCSMQ